MLSIVIPTLLKNVNILNMLIQELVEDDCVGEVIIIDNSTKGFNFESEKVKVIIPKQNLYVNPSWNLGIREAKYEYFGILNDDLILPKNMCRQVFNFIKNKENLGLVGLSNNMKEVTKLCDFKKYPKDSNILFKPMNDLVKDFDNYWGAAIFGNKNNYYNIPEEIKIYCGDDYLLKMNNDNNKTCYKICGCQIKHYGSLSCKSTQIKSILENDKRIYSKIDKDYEKKCILRTTPNFIQRLFSIRNESKEKYMYLCFLKFKLFEINN